MESREIYSKEHKLQGKYAVFGLVLLVLLGGYRAMSMKSFSDPTLESELKMELSPGVTFDITGELSNQVTIHSMQLSAPVFSISSNEEVVVKVEYSIDSGSRQTKYIRYLHLLGGSWRYESPTTIFGFYSNLIS